MCGNVASSMLCCSDNAEVPRFARQLGGRGCAFDELGVFLVAEAGWFGSVPRAETVNPGDDDADDEDDEDDDGKGDGTGNIDPDVDEGYDDDEDDDDEEPLWAGIRVSTDLLHRTIPTFPRRWRGGKPQRTRYRVRFPSRTRHTTRPGS